MTNNDPWQVAIDNRGLAYALARKFLNCGLEIDDLVQEGLIGLWMAATKFDPSRGVPFSSFSRFHMLYCMRMGIYRCGRWSQRAREVVDIEAPEPPEVIGDDECELIGRAINTLTDREKTVILLHYGFKGRFPQFYCEIGHEIGCTASRVCQIERGARAKLAERLCDGP